MDFSRSKDSVKIESILTGEVAVFWPRSQAVVSAICAVSIFTAMLAGFSPVNAQQSPVLQRPRRVESKPVPSAPRTGQYPPDSGVLEEVGDDDVIRVETQLVSVPVAVADKNGRPLINLSRTNFKILEDGREQTVATFATTETPFEVALLLDTSGSTRSELGLIKQSALAFIDALRPRDRAAIVGYNTARDGFTGLATVEIKSYLTSDRDQLRQAIQALGTSNGTPFYDSLIEIVDEVFRKPPSEELRGRRALVALTDAVDSTSGAGFEEAKAKLIRSGVASYFIQVNTEEYVEDRILQDCNDFGGLRLSRTQLQRYRTIFLPAARSDDFDNFCAFGPFEKMQISRSLYRLARQEMNDIARASGGKTFPVADLRDARAAFARVAEEIGTQFALGYYPTNKIRDGKLRRIKVEVRGVSQDTQIRAREGYYAPLN